MQQNVCKILKKMNILQQTYWMKWFKNKIHSDQIVTIAENELKSSTNKTENKIANYTTPNIGQQTL